MIYGLTFSQQYLSNMIRPIVMQRVKDHFAARNVDRKVVRRHQVGFNSNRSFAMLRLVWVADVCPTFADQKRGAHALDGPTGPSPFFAYNFFRDSDLFASICFLSSSLHQKKKHGGGGKGSWGYMVFGGMIPGIYLHTTLLFKSDGSVFFWLRVSEVIYPIAFHLVILDSIHTVVSNILQSL